MGIQVIKGGSISAYLKLSGNVALSAALISVVDQTNTVSGLQLATASIGLTMPTFLALPNWTVTLGIKDGFSSQQTVAVASLGTGVFRLIANKYTINNTAAQTGTITGYFLNATETALNGITHNLMDLQIGGVSQFRVDNSGNLFTPNIAYINQLGLGSGGTSFFVSGGSGIIRLIDAAGTSFNRLQFGGTTSSFPAIKRNGATIDFRLADDSANTEITASAINLSINVSGGFATLTNAGSITGGSNYMRIKSVGSFDMINITDNFVGISETAAISSAVFAIGSTTKGFLMPRMTQAQILAIVTPANGLEVYNTDLNQPCFYDGGAALWKKVSHSNM